MDVRITATELARSLSDVLNRIRYRGERFIVERNGEPIATIGPSGPAVGARWSDIVARIGHLKLPDEGFADDLEAIIAEQQPLEPPRAWDD